MAITALILYMIFAALGFGWRSWTQYRHTGSTGFRGIHGRPGSLEWFAGAGFVAAILAGLAAPLLQLLGILTPVALLQAPTIQTTGTVLAIAGIAATLYAQHDMGQSWRIGVDPSETTTLVRHGVFARVRNPIFTAMLIYQHMLVKPDDISRVNLAFATTNGMASVAFGILVIADILF